MKFWRVSIAVIACLGPLLQYGLMTQDQTLAVGALKTVRYFSYFTNLSNLLAAAALTAPLVAWGNTSFRRFALWAERAGPRVAIATYLTITALVYHLILASEWSPKGLDLLADTILHTVTPLAYLIDLAARGGEGEARWIAAAKAMVFPALFAAWTELHGALSGWYPYPFMNAAKHGYPTVMLNILAMSVAFASVALVFTLLSRVRARLALARPAPISA
jgi:hypothetical protein